ncbi:MAG: hypothetical protein Q4B58_07820 [Bacteroidales bacterium]|nr:hypothetical protein [Bacteroidales bacterium]
MSVNLLLEDSSFLKTLIIGCTTANEFKFIKTITHKMMNEPANSNELLISERENDDCLYLERHYDYEFVIGRHVGDFYYEEVHGMSLRDTLNTNLSIFGLKKQTLLEWLRANDYNCIRYDRNFDLM